MCEYTIKSRKARTVTRRNGHDIQVFEAAKRQPHEDTWCWLCEEDFKDGDEITAWGYCGDQDVHYKCADNYEPSDEDIERMSRSGYPTLTERLDAARRLK